MSNFALFAHLVHETRGEAAAAQDVVAHEQGEKVRVAARVAGLADEHVRLRACHRDVLRAGFGQRWHFGHGGLGGAGGGVCFSFVQAGEQRAGDGVGLCACGMTDKADARLAGLPGAAPEGA